LLDSCRSNATRTYHEQPYDGPEPGNAATTNSDDAAADLDDPTADLDDPTADANDPAADANDAAADANDTAADANNTTADDVATTWNPTHATSRYQHQFCPRKSDQRPDYDNDGPSSGTEQSGIACLVNFLA
jgi:hypothetical protein